mmetsp:Transcript_15376/g.64850  ORF Transcript_15376/g.64850 Transcript_15376/m.64850 type:complete len:91 (+) Transcript_15376:1658-1930(+)
MAPMPPMMRPEPSHCILSLARPQESQLPVHLASSSLPSARTTSLLARAPALRVARVGLRDLTRSVAAALVEQAMKVIVDVDMVGMTLDGA